ncbi:MAG TPA: phenylalanine--tRNA ligase beta subunit-related protein [Desulfomonilaceae bacterium]|nr:phenylalanine--tRNA ligase beta subunit-related protein [Desulfomonilaceae bacterium]
MAKQARTNGKQHIPFTVAAEIFAQFPGYVRGVVIMEGLSNGPSSEELVELLRGAEESLRAQLTMEGLPEHPRIASWREAYRSFGAKPTKFRPSIEAMARRVLKNDKLPSINAVVDIGNIVSLRHILPAGGHAMDAVTHEIRLRLATGQEEFIPLDSEQVEHPLPGEVIFAEGNTVLTRRWTWRQGKHTLVVPETTAVEVNIDGLPPVPTSEIEEACREVMSVIETFCGGSGRYEILSEASPTIML